jgi:hypothetical protein
VLSGDAADGYTRFAKIYGVYRGERLSMEESFSSGYWLRRQRLARDLRQACVSAMSRVSGRLHRTLAT